MCCAIVAMPPPDRITPDTPLRLGVAAAIAFPDGSMTASGLRREGARGRLVVERIAGKDYTTLAHIERMRNLCRLLPKDHGYGCAENAGTIEAGSHTPPPTSSGTVDIRRALAAAEMSVTKLKEGSKAT
jgi:hypothetical protein